MSIQRKASFSGQQPHPQVAPPPARRTQGGLRRYRRRTETVAAAQWTGNNLAEMPLGSFRHPEYDNVLVMPCQRGNLAALTVMVPLQYWVITEQDGMNAVRSEQDFVQHYEAAE